MHPRERETDLSDKAVPAASLGQTRERLSERERARARRGRGRGGVVGGERQREKEKETCPMKQCQFGANFLSMVSLTVLAWPRKHRRISVTGCKKRFANLTPLMCT